MNCTVCGGVPVDRAHVRTRGAGAGWEEDEYILLCRKHHVEQGQVGWNKFCKKYYRVELVLNLKGWFIVDRFGVKKIQKGK